MPTTAYIHPSELPVLCVDDKPSLLRSVSTILHSAGIRQILTLADSRQVLPLLTKQEVEVLIIDLRMPFLSGQSLLDKVTTDYPDVPVIVMTTTDDLNTAVDCMKAGAFDYLVKPVEKNRLVASVTRAIEIRGLREEIQFLKERLLSDKLKHRDTFATIVTQNSTA